MRVQEQRLALGAAVAAGAGFALIWRPWEGGPRWWFFVIGLTMAAVMGAGAVSGSRLFAAVGAFIVGLFGPWHVWFLVQPLYVGFAFWLGRQALREQAERT